MKWNEHKGGIIRSEEGHIVVQRGPKEWELTTPDGRTHRFVDAVQAKQFVEGVPDDETGETPKPQKPKPPAKKAATAKPKKPTKKAAAPADEGADLGKHHKKLVKYLERAAAAAEAGEFEDLAAALRADVEWPPSDEFIAAVDAAVPEDADKRILKVTGQLVERLGEDPEAAETNRGASEGADLYLGRVYSRVLTLEKLTS